MAGPGGLPVSTAALGIRKQKIRGTLCLEYSLWVLNQAPQPLIQNGVGEEVWVQFIFPHVAKMTGQGERSITNPTHGKIQL